MTAYLVITYDVSDPERYAEYNPGKGREIFATIKKYEGSMVVAGPTDVTVGDGPAICVCVSFPDADAAKAWQADDDYAPLKAIRYEATTNITEMIISGH